MAKMPGERTPLLTTVRVASPPPRYPHHTVRRFCTIALGSSLIAIFLTFLWTEVFSPPADSHVDFPGSYGSRISFNELQAILLGVPSAEKAAEWSKYYTSGPHLAGKNLSQVSIPY